MSHIMRSYNWDHQKLVKKVAAGLKERGIPAWMDLDKMSGDTNARYVGDLTLIRVSILGVRLFWCW